MPSDKDCRTLPLELLRKLGDSRHCLRRGRRLMTVRENADEPRLMAVHDSVYDGQGDIFCVGVYNLDVEALIPHITRYQAPPKRWLLSREIRSRQAAVGFFAGVWIYYEQV